MQAGTEQASGRYPITVIDMAAARLLHMHLIASVSLATIGASALKAMLVVSRQAKCDADQRLRGNAISGLDAVILQQPASDRSNTAC